MKLNQTKNIRFLAMALVVLFSSIALGQENGDMKITKFQHNPKDMTAAVDQVIDSNGKFCAVIRVASNDSTLQVEPNTGYEKIKKDKGEIILWVQNDTKYLDVHGANLLPLSYTISIPLQEKMTYEIEIKVKRKVSYPFFVNAGFNIMSIMGPSLSFGYRIGNLNFEAGAIVGIKKSDNLYYYNNSDGSLKSAFNYKALRVHTRVGYDVHLTYIGFITIEPQVGIAYNHIGGSSLSGLSPSDRDYMKNMSSLSGLIAFRAKFAINDHWHVQLTPEYIFGLAKNNELKMLNKANSKVKSWTDGVNFNLGLMVYF